MANAIPRHAAMSNSATTGPIKKYFHDTIATPTKLKQNRPTIGLVQAGFVLASNQIPDCKQLR